MIDFYFGETLSKQDLALLRGESFEPPKNFTNINAFILYNGKKNFLLKAKDSNLGLTNILVIEKSLKTNQKIYEINKMEKISEDTYDQREVCSVLGIIRILDKPFLVVVDNAIKTCTIDNDVIYQIGGTSFLPFDNEMKQFSDISARDIITYIQNIQKILASGYYFSLTLDLTLSKNKLAQSIQHTQIKFFWNHFIARGFYQQGANMWIPKIIQGYIGHFQIVIVGKKLDYYLFSRRSCFKAGTRYNARGIDDEGNVANYVECESVLYFGNACCSHIQIRGSVPLFWQQTGLTAQTKITRSFEMTQSAFLKHIADINQNYGYALLNNLMAQTKPGEQCLTQGFEEQVEKNKLSKMRYHFFDFHQACKGQKFEKINILIEKFQPVLEDFKFFAQNRITKEILVTQKGVIRTNCLDCLDRTNVFQGKLAAVSFSQMMNYLGINTTQVFGKEILELMDDNNQKDCHNFVQNFKLIWADNGDFISIHYSGTGSVISSVTRSGKPGLFGLFDHGMKSINRFYIGAFEDQVKQECIDMFLGQHTETINIFNEDVERNLQERENEYCTFSKLNLLITSWNVAGFMPESNYNIQDLLQFENEEEPDIIVLGLQEIIELNASNLLYQNNQEAIVLWQQIITQNLQKKNNFHLVKMCDLTGILLFILAKEQLTKRISKVEVDQIHSQYGNTFNNKGAVVVKLYIDDTSICFVNCYLDQDENNSKTRLAEINDIHSKSFQQQAICPKKEESIEQNNYKFLFGDFGFKLINDKIDKIKEKIDKLINNNNPQNDIQLILAQYDELNSIKNSNEYLSKYNESDIQFLPTYKYIYNSDQYNYTKKQKISLWPDRILYSVNKPEQIEQKQYNSRSHAQSDHRPVIAQFLIKVKKIDQEKKEKIIKQITEEAPLNIVLENDDLMKPDDINLNETSQALSDQNLICKMQKQKIY